MKCFPAIILTLCLGGLPAFAQPWQWQRYEENFYNPTGFPKQPIWVQGDDKVAIGDFNGDGRDEFYNINRDWCRIAVRDTDRFFWTTYEYAGQGRIGITGLWAADLDDDGQDELVIYADSVTVLKAATFDPWTWTIRNDLLAGLYIPPNLNKAIYGDYDGDGLLNAVCWTYTDSNRVELLHRTAAGIWHLDSTLREWRWLLDIFDGDFNNDGRNDFAVYYWPFVFFEKNGMVFFENTGAGIVRRNRCNYCSTFKAGGDLNSDGQWDQLERDIFTNGATYNRAGYYLQHAAPDTARFVRFVNAGYLGDFRGSIIGNFHTINGPEIVGIFNRTYDRGFIGSACGLESYSNEGWRRSMLVSQPGGDFFSGHLFSASAADLDGDGRKDIAILLSGNSYSGLSIYQNTGSDSFDSIAPGWGTAALTNRFPRHPDTLFSSPQIGNIEGDSRAELAMLVQPNGGTTHVEFLELIGAIADTTFVVRPAWSAGLPSGLLAIRLADLDGDGVCEVIGKTTGNNIEGHWEVYFRRHGRWDFYENILPAFSAPDISFADLDDDGDLDLFTPAEVWVSLSPSAADDNISLPASFILSAYPNPFNARTTITFTLPQTERVKLELFNLLGQSVRVLADARLPAGEHVLAVDGADLAAGIYFVRLQSVFHVKTVKVALIK